MVAVDCHRALPWPISVRSLAALLTTTVLAIGACTYAPPSSPPVIPPETTPASGGSTQFTTQDGSPAIWGLTERGFATAASAPVYPLRVAANGRHIVDQTGAPWRVQADAAWLMSVNATPDEVDQYLATRRAQGFNSFYLMAMVHQTGYASAAPNAPNDLAGDPPFAVPGDFSTAGASPASARYWSWIDSVIAKASQHGMVVMLAYTYLGYGGGDQGWYQEILSQPDRQALYNWGRWLGLRYKDAPNVIWFGLGDYTPPSGSEGAARVRAIADGIKSAGATQLFMAEPSGPDGLPVEVDDFGSIVDLDSFYGYGPGGFGAVYVTADRAYRYSPTKPAWMEEGTYELENNTGFFSGQPWDTRRGRFWSVLGGGTAGDGFGSARVWQWFDFPASLQTDGAQYSSDAFDLFASLPWWTLRPSGTDSGFAGRNLVPAGAGTYGNQDFITSALTEDGHWLLAYVPVMHKGARTFSVDMSALSGPVHARWFDPATGTYLAIGDGQLHASSGVQSFTTPGMRSDQTDDWLLVIDTEVDPCGTISADGLYTPPPTPPPSWLVCEVTASRPSDLSIISREPAPT